MNMKKEAFLVEGGIGALSAHPEKRLEGALGGIAGGYAGATAGGLAGGALGLGTGAVLGKLLKQPRLGEYLGLGGFGAGTVAGDVYGAHKGGKHFGKKDLKKGKEKESSMQWHDSFIDELQKIAADQGASTQELIRDLSPRGRGFTEKALPVASTIGGTLGGAGTVSALGGALPGWKGKALKGLGGIAGGLTGLGLGSAGKKALIKDRRIDAYEELMSRRR